MFIYLGAIAETFFEAAFHIFSKSANVICFFNSEKISQLCNDFTSFKPDWILLFF